MIENGKRLRSRLADYFQKADHPNEEHLSWLSYNLARSLNLEEGLGDSSPLVRQSVLDEISRSIYHAVEFLDLPDYPDFGLTFNWGEKPPDGHLTPEGAHILATANMNKTDAVNGIVRFSPAYLQTMADFKKGKDTKRALAWGIKNPLAMVASHEIRHLGQFVAKPTEIKRDLRVFVKSGVDGWTQTPMEREARQFGALFNEAITIFDASKK